ncbi:LOW QUALITY PROTEIN: paired amphipathic helix protein Sin3b [Callorhinchus milii]|uniref:LOW QUALITY PROTEIN: paired amphipathic helix protein Sin3b n=1 Tax=Callorhinchus milii TaxID=7868 RepID=UPI001C3F89F9|nr:LOW QUALITY PROTEIN: paired amphipathic helix protein Sin3b [Callorhinchus milii]
MPGVVQGSNTEPLSSHVPRRRGETMAKIQAHLQQINHQIQAQTYAVQKQAQQQFQRLKCAFQVEDALSYLDQVKMQFGNNPAVYNEFLDIMKEFKSQSIDTPGVIDRVSRLFQGHPDLILGFNAFLPPGYRIEIQKNKAVSVHGPTLAETQVLSEVAHKQTAPTPINVSGAPVTTTTAHGDQVPSQSPLAGHKEERADRRAPREDQAARPEHHEEPAPSDPHPVEFDNAISYVNKIKNRYLDRPEVYKSFLEILHTYQKEQLIVKDTKGKPYCGMTEDEVFAKVANLFRGQEDLLTEFGQFLPDAKRSLFTGNASSEKDDSKTAEEDDGNKHSQSKKRVRPALLSQVPPPVKKKLKLSSVKDRSLASAGKHGTLREFSFFDRVRRVLKSQEVYENFLRCIALFNQEVVSGSELLQLVTPFLGKFPELFARFKSFLGQRELSLTQPVQRDRPVDGIAREIDYASCKRLGSSYRALPKTYQQPKCSGRTAVCKEVLNDTWVSFPSWSEDSTFVSSKKTPYEEQLHRCEDERFELDVVLETNLATIRVLESVQKKLSRMCPEDQDKYHLDDCLGGTSEVIHRRAIYRIYGDKAPEIIDGLKKNPITAVPVVLKRLKAKEDEWREAQQGFNKIWREQYEKSYLKSLDHQGVNFKQNDTKALRSKSLLNEIESVYDERQEQNSEEGCPGVNGPHLTFVYEDKQILEDVASLLVYHVKRQPTIQKEDKDHIKRIIYHFVPDLFFSRRGELSESESSTDDELESDQRHSQDSNRHGRENGTSPQSSVAEERLDLRDTMAEHQKNVDDVYNLFFVNNNWYFFLRLHQILCYRLLRIYRQAEKQLLEYQLEKEREKLFQEGRKEKVSDPAVELRLKQQSEIELEEYYPAFLDMVRNLLDGNIEPTQYEDTLREMFTIHAYIGFTVDKLIQNIVRQLQHLVSDDVCVQATELYLSERKRGAAGGALTSQCVRATLEAAYQVKAERIMPDENCFKIMFIQSKGQVTMTVELLDTEEAPSDDPLEVQNLTNYMEQYVGPEAAQFDQCDGFFYKPVFLPRNLRKFRKWQQKQFLSLRNESRNNRQRCLGVENSNSMDCKFKLNTHKLVYVMNSEDFMYRCGALHRARESQSQVARYQHHQFQEWHNRWLEENVTDETAELVQDWLMGEDGEDMIPCKTVCKTDIIHDIPVNRYRVQYSRCPPSP